MATNDGDYLYQQEGYDLMAAAFEVYNEKGNGFLEDVYQESLELELGFRDIPFLAKTKLHFEYKGHRLKQGYEPDLIVFKEIIAELKAVQKLAPEHLAQLMNYLKATQKRVGYLINFGHYPKLEWKRVVVD